MLDKVLLAAAATFLVASAADAADLIIEEVDPVVDPIVADGFYLSALGGVALAGTLDHYDAYSAHDHDLDAGLAVAGVVGYQFDNGFAVELDLLHTNRNQADSDYGLSTTSLMAGVRYGFDVTDMVTLYVGAGLGGIWTNDEVWEDQTFGAGYQLKAGVEVAVTDNLSLVGEYRFQNAFGELDSKSNDFFSNKAPVSAVMAGFKLSL